MRRAGKRLWCLLSLYDTISTFLDSSIRRVIERCLRAAENHDGIEAQDVNVLKLLYLLRYIGYQGEYG